MKNKLLNKNTYLLIILSTFAFRIFAQTNNTSWLIRYNDPKDRVFVENKGQFQLTDLEQSSIKYGFDGGQSKIYFTDKGVIFRFAKQVNTEKTGEKEEANLNEEENDNKKIETKTDIVYATWEGANSDVQIVAEDETTDYYSYSIKENGGLKNINHIAAFKKIIYKNLYPNIDVEYVFHPDKGIEYSIILHPGADITQVKLHYSDGHQVQLMNGDVHISTDFGDIIDHAPTTFYSDNHSNIVNSRFLQTGNTISFGLENYDNTKEVTIDPWTITPSFPNSGKVWNTQVDGAGNVYLYGGDTPLALKKYSAAGLLQWTYNTPWDSANYWMGTMITDLAGNSYVTSGSNGEISKVNTSGGLVWHNNPNGLFGPLYEYWHLAFNCDQTQLVVGGMTTPSALSASSYRGAIMNINLTNGAILGTIIVGGYSSGFPPTIHEVRSICPSSNGNFYFMTLDSIGSITPALTLNYKSINNYNFAYGSPSYTVKGNLGLNAMKTNGNFIYTQSGKTVDKRNISNGSIVASAPIPGGTSSSFLGTNSPGNSGLDIDSCGNVYVGSSNQVVKYDANLIQLATAATPSAVYDVAVNNNGEVIACGNGFAASIAMSNCHPIKPICLICVPPTIIVTATPSSICAGSSSTLLASGATSYSWSTGATTNPITVNPVATTTYTVTGTSGGCTGSATVTVTVNPPPTITVNSPTICNGTSATLTGTGGTSYSWSTGAITASITVSPATTTSYTVTGTDVNGCTNSAVATVTVVPTLTVTATASPSNVCKGNPTTITGGGATSYSWSTGATTNSITGSPLSTATYTVTGTTSGCTGTATVKVIVNLPPDIGVNSPTICNGTSATLTSSGGTSYSWSTGATTNPITVNPATTTSYTVTGTDVNGCTNTAVATVTVNPIPTITVNSPTICAGTSATLTGSGGTSYSWNTGATTTSITVNPATTTSYTVTGTDVNGCTNSAVATVTVGPGLAVTATASPTAICVGSSTTITGGGATTYSWSTGATTNPITVNPVATTTYTVTGTSGSCTGSATVTVTVNPIPTITVNSPTICSGTSATLTGTGGTSYSWNTGATTTSITVSPAITTSYTVTGTNVNGCTNSAVATVTVNPNPTVTATASPTAICVGSSTTITGGGATTYSWNTGATTTSITVSPATTTTYTVTGTSGVCTGSATVTVTVNPIPTVTVNSPTICSGTSTTLTGSGGTSYSWSTGATTTSITVNPVTTTSYTVTGTNVNGCTNSAVATVTVGPGLAVTAISSPTNICVGSSASLTASGATTYSWSTGANTNPITVNPVTTTTYTVTGTSGSCTGSATVTVTINPPPTITVNSPTICSGTSATLTGSGGTSYSWSTGATTTSITVNPATTTSYTVTGTDANGCTNSTIATVAVNPNPTVTASSSASSAVCAGDLVTLTASGATSYSWSTGSTNNPTTVNPNSTSTYTVTGTTGGCTGSATVSVTVNPRPLIDSTNALFPPICKGAVGSISGVTTSGGTGPYTYSWTPSGQTTANATGLSAGSYTLTVTDANGCTSTSGPYTITTSLVTAAFTANPDSGTAPLNVNFTNTSSGANSYEWYLGNGDTTNAINPTTNYANTGTYNVVLIATNSNGCRDTTYGKIDVFGQSILIVPNVFSPNGDGKNDVFTVKAEAISTFDAEIFDRWGIKLYEWNTLNGGWDGRTTGGVEVPAGTYYYLIKAMGFDGKQYVEKGYLTLIR